MPNIEIRKSIVSDFEPIRNLLITCFGERKENDSGLFEAVTSGKFMVLTIDDKVTATLSITPTASDLYVECSAS